MIKNWQNLYNRAKNNLKSTELSPFISCGSYSCVLKTTDNNIYSGINIESNSKINTTAESSAIIDMINNGEKEVSKLLVLNELEEIVKPSEDAIMYLISISDKNMETDILIDDKEYKLKELLPDWFGTYRPKR